MDLIETTPVGPAAATRSAALLELAASYRPASAEERRFDERLVALLARGESAFARSEYAPGHVTASAFVTSPDRGALLLVHHKKLGIWVQPGGHVDPADLDVVAAARREVAEETGLDELVLSRSGIFDLDIHSVPARGEEPAHEHFDVRFLFRATSLEVAGSAEVKAVRWIGPGELRAAGADRSVLRAAAKLWPVAG